jgi:hypothetical protein
MENARALGMKYVRRNKSNRGLQYSGQVYPMVTPCSVVGSSPLRSMASLAGFPRLSKLVKKQSGNRMDVRGYLTSRKIVAAIIITVFGAAVLLGRYLAAWQLEQQLIRISRQDPAVQDILEQYPSARPAIVEDAFGEDGTVYDCWVVTWFTESQAKPDALVSVWIEKSSLEIVQIFLDGVVIKRHNGTHIDERFV